MKIQSTKWLVMVVLLAMLTACGNTGNAGNAENAAKGNEAASEEKLRKVQLMLDYTPIQTIPDCMQLVT